MYDCKSEVLVTLSRIFRSGRGGRVRGMICSRKILLTFLDKMMYNNCVIHIKQKKKEKKGKKKTLKKGSYR